MLSPTEIVVMGVPETKTVEAIATSCSCPLIFDVTTILLKTPHTLVIGHGEI